GAAVDFHTQLPEPLAVQFRLRLDPQAGTVGVRADQSDAALQRAGLTQAEGNQRRLVAQHVVAPTSREIPLVTLVQLLIAGGLQTFRQAAGGMEGRGGSLDEIGEGLTGAVVQREFSCSERGRAVEYHALTGLRMVDLQPRGMQGQSRAGVECLFMGVEPVAQKRM